MEPPGFSFAKHMADMSKSARIALSRSGIPEELRNKIMKKTIYGNLSSLAPLVDIEYNSFREMIDVYHIIHNQVLEIYPELDPSWVIKIIEKFIKFLKTTPPNSVPYVLGLMELIITEQKYLTQSQVYENERMPRDEYRVWVDRFIQNYSLDTTTGEKLTRFFDEVVAILSDVFDEMTDNYRHSLAITCSPDKLYTKLFSKQEKKRKAILTAILIIRTSVIDGMIPLFEILVKLNRKYADHPLMKILTFEKMLKLDSELKKLKQGGGGLTRSKRSNKKRSNKKRSNKNKHNS